MAAGQDGRRVADRFSICETPGAHEPPLVEQQVQICARNVVLIMVHSPGKTMSLAAKAAANPQSEDLQRGEGGVTPGTPLTSGGCTQTLKFVCN